MHEVLQVASKIVIIAAIFMVAGFTALRVWRAEIDLQQLINPRGAVDRSVGSTLDWIPTRDPDKLYQHGEAVAIVSDATVDKKNRTVTFQKVNKALKLDRGKEFEFQKWRLRYERADGEVRMRGRSVDEDQAFVNMICEITGTRGIL